MALQSEDQDGRSNIVIHHEEETGRVRATLGTARYVVTEYGIANLFGKSIRERVLAMIDIAHPRHRDMLLKEAKIYGYAYPDQIYISSNAANYPVELKTVKTFKDNLELSFRPIKPSDEDMMRRLFYEFSDEAKYLRYFAKVSIMPHREMQKYVNIDYDTTVSIVAVFKRDRAENIIAEARYSFDAAEQVYEMAFIVDEKYQNRGISTFMLGYLIKIAKERGIHTLSSSILPQNEKMLKVFQKASIPFTSKYEDSIIKMRFYLQEP